MATDQLINKTQGDAIIAGLAAIKNAINDQPVPTQVEDVVSDAFDVGVSYVPGDYCIYENKLYKCDVAHHGAWDGNDFTLTNVGAELDTLNNALSNIYFNGSNYTYLGQSIPYNSSYTAPVDGIYIFTVVTVSSGSGAVIYADSNRTKNLISNAGDKIISVAIPLKKGTTVYTRNASNGNYSVYGYIS